MKCNCGNLNENSYFIKPQLQYSANIRFVHITDIFYYGIIQILTQVINNIDLKLILKIAKREISVFINEKYCWTLKTKVGDC